MRTINSNPSPASMQEGGLKISYQEFLADSDEPLAEWVAGEIKVMSPPSEEHQDISDFLTALLRHFVEAHQAGVVRSAPFQMKTGPDLPGREPDILFLAQEHLERLQKNFLDGPADLAVEIVSPESGGRDRGEKFYEYESGGVSEYWLIDPLRQQAEFYQRDSAGIYQLVPPDSNGHYHSAVLPGLWLDVQWLWQRPLPLLLTVLKAWGLL